MSAEQTPALLTLAAEYEILRELGRGGTAVVYLARERSTGREVAIKLIHAKYVEDEEALARFAREARFAAQLDHPNVVPVHAVLDLGNGGIALVMAHVSGRTLKQRIRDEGALSADHAERVMRDIAQALGAAHAMGIVHRDVKPENIFIEESGRGGALLADFGVARSMSSDTQQLTMSGVAIGTPTYMAPEQIDGGQLDGRGDIYSLGLVAWEMLTGRRPWDGEALYSVLYHQKHVQLPDVREMRPDVPVRLAEAIGGAIEKDREARWQNVPELLAALDGNAPRRRTAIVAATSSDTVRFSRPPVSQPSAPPPPSLAPPAAAYLDPASFSPEVPLARSAPRRRVLIAGAIVALLALTLVATAVQGWTDKRRSSALLDQMARSDAKRDRAPVLQSASAGEVSRDTMTLVGADAPRSVDIGAVQTPPVSPPAALPKPSAPPMARDTVAGTPAPEKGAISPSRNVKTAPAPASPPVTTSAAVAVAATPVAPTPAPPVAPTRVRIVAGGRHTCLVSSDGRAFCWGGNDRGQLGSGATARVATPLLVAADLRFTAVAAGLSHSCALTRDGAAWCWGENDHGQLGDRTTTARPAPVRVAEGRAFRSVSAGASHNCALDGEGIAWCWGSNAFGQLGDGGTKDQARPTAVDAGSRFASIDAGWSFTCALDAAGEAMCWGDNSAGQLGDGGTGARRRPAPVRGRLAFRSISAGNAHACGITARGEAYCWGSNSSGQLGDGTTSNRGAPVRVGSDERFVAIAAGAVHTCAIAADGDAFCWGRNTYGQLGDGGTDDRSLPARVAGGHAFGSIRAFGSHTCGATVSGEAFCWGYNLDGQLGDGTRTHRTRPVYVERSGGG